MTSVPENENLRMHAVSATIVSSVTAAAAMRTPGFFASRHSMISAIFPEEPPIKAWVGAGRSPRAAGAVPVTTVTLEAPSRRAFSPMRAAASSRRSIANTLPEAA